MISDYEIIKRLYIERLSGLISTEDESNLQLLIEKDVANKIFYESLIREAEELEINKFIEDLSPEKELSLFKRRIKDNQNNYHWFSSAAAIFFVIGLAFLYWFPKEEIISYTAKPIPIKNNGKVQLFVEDKSINLDGKDSIISTGDITINTSGNAIESMNGAESTALNTLVVPVKLDYQITLSDGTRVFLNSVSKLRFPTKFFGKTREIFLEGEAFLEVAKDKDKPFIVHTKEAAVKVLGTSFNVNTYGSDMKTSLVEGSVLLTAKHEQRSLKLTPGIQANYNANSGFKTNPFDAEEVLSWREGVYYFYNLKIKDLAPLINRWFDMSLDFQSNRYNDFAISGLIEKGQLQAFLKDLEASADIKYEISGKEIRFK